MQNLLGVHNSFEGSKYLDLPCLIGRSKKALFNFLKDRLWRQVNSWSNKAPMSREGDSNKVRLSRNLYLLYECV